MYRYVKCIFSLARNDKYRERNFFKKTDCEPLQDF